jgi:hypothetical protein
MNDFSLIIEGTTPKDFLDFLQSEFFGIPITGIFRSEFEVVELSNLEEEAEPETLENYHFYLHGKVIRVGREVKKGGIMMRGDLGVVEEVSDIVVGQVRKIDSDTIQVIGNCLKYMKDVVILIISHIKETFPKTLEKSRFGAKREDSLTWTEMKIPPEGIPELNETEDLCIKWAGRGYIPDSNMDEWLSENLLPSGKYLTKDQFKKALGLAGEKGLIIKGKNRRWKLLNSH